MKIAESLGLDRFPFAQVADWLAAGDIVPFVGSGASRVRDAEIKSLPDSKGLAGELVKKMEGAYPADSTDDLAKVAQVFEYTVFDRELLYDFLHNRFEVQQLSEQPSDVAVMLAELPRGDVPLFLITTNYDSLIERAFTAAGRPICVITQGLRDAYAGQLRLNLTLPDGAQEQVDSTDFSCSDRKFPADCAFLFKMHGSVHNKQVDGRDNVIITEDDYIDFIVNTGGSVSPLFPPPALTKAFKDRRFLFLGYSLHDWNFRAFLRVLALRNALSGRDARRHWAVQLHPDSVEVDLWRHRNVNVYDGDLAQFCQRLRQVKEREAS